MPKTSLPEHVYDPEMRVTGYDSARALLVALLLGFAASAGVVSALYVMLRPKPAVSYVPIELPDVDGGFEDGRDSESPDVDSAEVPRPDAAPEEVDTEILELEQSLESLADVSPEAAQMLPPVSGTEADSAGVLGSSDGDGGRPLGVGAGAGGVPREKRWLVRFSGDASVAEYARQLDFFRIELGVITPEGKLVFASDLAASSPKIREVQSGAGENRLFFQWEGGPRRIADRQLFAKAGVNPGTSPILHFYHKDTENLLAQLEFKASGGVETKAIRRTFFDVVRNGDQYEFEVARVVKFAD